MIRQLADLALRVAELERRAAGAQREGVVHAVNPATQRVRLRVGGTDDQPFLTPWIPYAQHAGALKLHSPPSVGQQMTALAPGGDLRRAKAIPFTWSDAEPSPSAAGDEHVLTFGQIRIELQADRLRIIAGASEISIGPDGIRLEAPQIVTAGTTRLNEGERAVVFVGSKDTRGDTNTEGAADVFV